MKQTLAEGDLALIESGHLGQRQDGLIHQPPAPHDNGLQNNSNRAAPFILDIGDQLDEVVNPVGGSKTTPAGGARHPQAGLVIHQPGDGCGQRDEHTFVPISEC